MRMRQFGHGQSVMFFAPTETDRLIRQATNLVSDGEEIQARNVVLWVLSETCADIRHHIPHWAQQGIDFHRRYEAETKYQQTREPDCLHQGWLTAESRPLEELYGIHDDQRVSFTQAAFAVPNLFPRLRELGVGNLDDPGVDEEQEREVSHEVEIERQVERPPKMEPAEHTIHEHVRKFVQRGSIPPASPQFLQVLGTIKPGDMTSPDVFGTLDFFKTVRGSKAGSLSEYIRPVHWILSAKQQERTILVAISPFEANQLLPEIRARGSVCLHMFNARVTQSMPSMTNLNVYALPAQLAQSTRSPKLELRTQLGLWAGQLYLDDMDTYRHVCQLLGVKEAGDEDELMLDPDERLDSFYSSLPLQPLTDRTQNIKIRTSAGCQGPS